MFCTTCATRNALRAGRCASCGARLGGAGFLGSAGTRRRAHLLHRGLYLVPVLALVVATFQVTTDARAKQQAMATAYARGEEAAAEGRYLDALNAYADAGDYGDTEARQAEIAARLVPYEAAYLDGLTAFDAGRYDEAVASFVFVARDLPDYRDVAFLLVQARDARQAELVRQAETAEAAGDWLTAERALAELAAGDPEDEALAARLAAIRRDHAPFVFGRGHALYLVGPDQADERLLTDQVPVSWPIWSPARSRIAFISPGQAATSGQVRLYVINSDGSGLTELATGVRPYSPAVWSPDGTRIAYTSEVDVSGVSGSARRSIHYVDVATRRVTDVTSTIMDDATSPTWSPSGDRLAFASRLSNAGVIHDPRYPAGGIYILTLTTGEIAPAAGGRFPYAWRVAWSPAAETLLIYSRTEGSSYDRTSLSLLDLRTGGREDVDSTTQNLTIPVWSPDGTRFAYIAGTTTVHLQTPGEEPVLIETGLPLGRFLTWSPDGEALVVAATVSGGDAVLLRLTSGAVAPIPLQITYDADRRLGGPPQWAPLNPQRAAPTPSLSGTARDPGQ